jgi:hypothetical protein
MRFQWRLREYLAARGVSVYALSQAMGGVTRAPALYAITNADPAKRPRRVNFETLESIIDALERITGEPVHLGDLLVRDETARGPSRTRSGARSGVVGRRGAMLEPRPAPADASPNRS